jgi:hypothetical protein
MADVALDEIAERMLAGLDPRIGVGTRHHTVPRFILERFADRDQVLRLDMQTKRVHPANIRDLALKDFYTFVKGAGRRR